MFFCRQASSLFITVLSIPNFPDTPRSSPELVLSFFHPYSVHSGQELRLWYGEDFMNISEADNGGRACVDIYALYV